MWWRCSGSVLPCQLYREWLLSIAFQRHGHYQSWCCFAFIGPQQSLHQQVEKQSNIRNATNLISRYIMVVELEEYTFYEITSLQVINTAGFNSTGNDTSPIFLPGIWVKFKQGEGRREKGEGRREKGEEESRESFKTNIITQQWQLSRMWLHETAHIKVVSTSNSSQTSWWVLLGQLSTSMELFTSQICEYSYPHLCLKLILTYTSSSYDLLLVDNMYPDTTLIMPEANSPGDVPIAISYDGFFWSNTLSFTYTGIR